MPTFPKKFSPLIQADIVYAVDFMVYSVDMTATTAQKIAGAARRLLDKEGAEGVTMRRVATAVGITPMALYRHYPNRDGLLNALADAGFVELTAKLAGLRLTGRRDRSPAIEDTRCLSRPCLRQPATV